MLRWFTDNDMKPNPSKLQIMFSGQEDLSKLSLNINGLLILSRKQVKPLGDNINNSLKFDAHMKELCRKVNQKVHAFGRLRSFLGEQKAKVLFNSVIRSNFSYCPLIWLFCSKGANNEINQDSQTGTKSPVWKL